MSECRRQLRIRRECANRGELTLQGLDAEGLDASRVHEARVEIADFALIAAGGRLRFGGVLENRVQGGAALFGELVERTPTRCVGRNGCLLEPGSIHETEEVVLWPDGMIEVCRIDAERARRALLLLSASNGRERQQCASDRRLRIAGKRRHVCFEVEIQKCDQSYWCTPLNRVTIRKCRSDARMRCSARGAHARRSRR